MDREGLKVGMRVAYSPYFLQQAQWAGLPFKRLIGRWGTVRETYVCPWYSTPDWGVEVEWDDRPDFLVTVHHLNLIAV